MRGRHSPRSLVTLEFVALGLGVAVALLGIGLDSVLVLAAGAGIGFAGLIGLAAIAVSGDRRGNPIALRSRQLLTRVRVQPLTEVDPTEVGIDMATQDVLPGAGLPRYLPRAVDAELQGAVEAALSGTGPWIVVAVGGSKVGKSRSLLEAVRRCAAEQEIELVAPVDGIALRSLLASPGGAGGRRSVLWLDDLEPFLSQGVTLQTLREWHHGVEEGVVAATYGGKGSDMIPGWEPNALATIAAEVLEHAHEVSIARTTGEELNPLRSELPDDALRSIEEHGLAAYLVAAPSLVRKLQTARHAPGEPECPEGVALVHAAIDWLRCGRRDPIPEETLRELWPRYLRAELRATDASFEAGLGWALRGVAGTVALLLHQKGGYRAYDYAVQIVDGEDPPPPHDATWARAIEGASDAQALAVGTSAYRYQRYENALSAFEIASKSPSSEIALAASFNLGVTLDELGRLDEAIGVYGQLIERFGGDESLSEQVAAAWANKGFALAAMERREEAVATFDELVERFGDAPEPGVRELVAKVLVNKGVALKELERQDAAVAALAEVKARFGDAPQLGLRIQVAAALINEGLMMNEVAPEDALAAFDEVIARYGDSPERELDQFVGRAMGNKGVALVSLERLEEAIATYRQLMGRYGDSSDPALAHLAAQAWLSQGLAFATLGLSSEAIAVFEEVVRRYREDSDPELRELAKQAETAMNLAASALTRTEGIDSGDVEALDRANVAVAERLHADFERNLREPVSIAALHLSGLDVFADMSWELHSSVNLLLGRNGYGKSLLLRLVVGMLQRDAETTGGLFRDTKDGRVEIEVLRSGEPKKIARDRSVFLRGSLGKVPLLAIPDARFMDRSTTTVADAQELNLATDGATHFLEQLPYQSAVDGLLNGLALDYWTNDETFDLPSFSLITDVLGRLADRSFEFRRIDRVGRTGAEIWVRTEGLDRDLEIQRASQGTLSVITIFGIIHAFLHDVAAARGLSGSEEVRNQAAIVVIDEVDAHLHPVWQQKIRNTLVDFFPRVQFLLTAHSPLVVAGCGPHEVSVMRRTGDRFDVQQIKKDFVGASAQELYSEIFDVEDLDENFLEYAWLNATGQSARVDAELETLFAKEKSDGLAKDEQERFERLQLDSRRLARVEQVNTQRRSTERQVEQSEAEVLRLREQLERLKGSDASP